MRRRSSIEEAAREVGTGVFQSSYSEVSGLVFVVRALAARSFVFYNNVTLMVTTVKLINAVLCA